MPEMARSVRERDRSYEREKKASKPKGRGGMKKLFAEFEEEKSA